MFDLNQVRWRLAYCRLARVAAVVAASSNAKAHAELLLERFAGYYPDIPFTDQPSPGLRYHYQNPAYGYSDAIMLHCMLRHLAPRRVVEARRSEGGTGFDQVREQLARARLHMRTATPAITHYVRDEQPAGGAR